MLRTCSRVVERPRGIDSTPLHSRRLVQKSKSIVTEKEI
jgi:hypothetical protein